MRQYNKVPNLAASSSLKEVIWRRRHEQELRMIEEDFLVERKKKNVRPLRTMIIVNTYILLVCVCVCVCVCARALSHV